MAQQSESVYAISGNNSIGPNVLTYTACGKVLASNSSHNS